MPARATPVATRQPSPEFIAWRRAWRTYYEACKGDEDEVTCNRLCEIHPDGLEALVEAVNAKESPSLADVVELAEAMRDSGYEGDVDTDDWIGATSCGIEHALVRAVLKMGGVYAQARAGWRDTSGPERGRFLSGLTTVLIFTKCSGELV